LTECRGRRINGAIMLDFFRQLAHRMAVAYETPSALGVRLRSVTYTMYPLNYVADEHAWTWGWEVVPVNLARGVLELIGSLTSIKLGVRGYLLQIVRKNRVG